MMRYIKTILFGFLLLLSLACGGIAFLFMHHNPATFVVPSLERALKNPHFDILIKTENSTIHWEGWRHPLSVTVESADIFIPQWNINVKIPKMSVHFKALPLVLGRFSLKTLVCDSLIAFFNGQLFLEASASIKHRLRKFSVQGKLLHLNLAKIQSFLPLKSSFSAILEGDIDLTIGTNGTIYPSKAYIQCSEGHLSFPSFFEKPLNINQMRMDISVDNKNLSIDAFHLQREEAFIEGTVKARINNWKNIWEKGGSVQLDLDGQGGNIKIDDLRFLWPEFLAYTPRKWVLQNLSDGSVPAVILRMTGNLQTTPFLEKLDFTIQQLDGEIEAKDVTVHYFGNLPSVKNTSGYCTFTRQDFFISAGGNIGDVFLNQGKIIIHDVDKKDQTINLDLDIQGPVSQCLEIISQKPLYLPQKLDLKPKNIHGQANVRVLLNFPLEVHVPLSDVQVQTTATIQDAFITSDIKFGKSPLKITNGKFNLDVNTHQLNLMGTTKIIDVPSSVSWTEYFDDENVPFQRQFHVQNTLNQNLFPQLSPFFHGSIPLNTTYTVSLNKEGIFEAKADLSKATLSLPWLDWKKMDGEKGAVHFKIKSTPDKASAIEILEISAPHLTIKGTGQFKDSKIETFLTHNSHINSLPLSFSLKRLNNGGIDVSAHLTTIDLTNFMKTLDDFFPLNDHLDDITYGDLHFLNLKADTVIFSPEYHLNNVKADLFFQPTALISATVQASPGKEYKPFQFSVAPLDEKRQIFTLETGNGANLLELAETGYDLNGGFLRIEGVKSEIESKKPQISGRLTLNDFDVKKAPLLAKILSAASVIGLPSLASGHGIHFESGQVDFNLEDDQISLQNLLLIGSSLGLTLKGFITKQELDLTGEIIPFIVLNKLVTGIPLLGKILSGGHDHGVFLTPFKVFGKRSKPTVTANPLTAILPGGVRRIFDETMTSQPPSNHLGQILPSGTSSKDDGSKEQKHHSP